MSDCKGPPTIIIDCECALLTEDGWVAGQDNVTKQEFTKKRFVNFRSFNLKYGRSSDEFEELLLTNIIPNGNLTFRCKMWKCSVEINNDGYCTARTHI
ncbi:hypothetical protein CDAR_2001 [Caerostris darwini]|uniref:Uncharacterized protein n=1 Tax=Caerostris darwini TaxID=1538125 RepID=A0AAV4WWK2_9ARAC|nr:hypothetical protein CDAR_2001 [Caerostris darwini]